MNKEQDRILPREPCCCSQPFLWPGSILESYMQLTGLHSYSAQAYTYRSAGSAVETKRLEKNVHIKNDYEFCTLLQLCRVHCTVYSILYCVLQ